MKAQDLRIGNLVTIDNEEFHPTMKDIPLQVTQILERESLERGIWTHAVSLEYPNKLKNVYYQNFGQYLEFIKPIPLTEEWLIKFGFEPELKNKDSINGEFIVYWKYPFVFNTNHGWWLYSKQLKIQPEYVHQLQNLYFALTGEELTIKP